MTKFKIYADGIRPDKHYIADIIDSLEISGFTINPTLVKNISTVPAFYKNYCQYILAYAEGLPVSIQVLSEDPIVMVRQAREINSWGPNILIKIPIKNSRGIYNSVVINELYKLGINVNITAIFSTIHVNRLFSTLFDIINFDRFTLSLFCGRIYDLGLDAYAEIERLRRSYEQNDIIWAGARTLYDIKGARQTSSIITIPEKLLDKMKALKDKSIEEYSRETVTMFTQDGSEFKI